MSKTLLVVHHTPSPTTGELLEAVLAGTHDPDIEGVDIEVRPALAATVLDMLNADGYLFGTTTNLGYMSGAPVSRQRHPSPPLSRQRPGHAPVYKVLGEVALALVRRICSISFRYGFGSAIRRPFCGG